MLRDAFGWRAADVADLLGASTASVNSALQRARAACRNDHNGEEPALHGA